jgi:glucoamylase
MPLVWAHAEHLKLLRSLADGAVFDLPPQTAHRYLQQKHVARCRPWRPDFRSTRIPAARTLRIDLPHPATLHWTADSWSNAVDTPTRDTGFGLHVAEIASADMRAGTRITFTWRRTDNGEWAGHDYAVDLA